MKHHIVRGKPDAIIRTCKSQIHMYVHYEEDPEKALQAQEASEQGLRYIAKQGGWLDVLDERDAAMKRIIQLSAELDKIRK